MLMRTRLRLAGCLGSSQLQPLPTLPPDSPSPTLSRSVDWLGDDDGRRRWLANHSIPHSTSIPSTTRSSQNTSSSRAESASKLAARQTQRPSPERKTVTSTRRFSRDSTQRSGKRAERCAQYPKRVREFSADPLARVPRRRNRYISKM